MENGKVKDIQVIRGAPCGATWKVISKLKEMDAETAIVRIGLETQFYCSADPAGWDPIYGKSPVHFAGHVHSAALKKSLT